MPCLLSPPDPPSAGTVPSGFREKVLKVGAKGSRMSETGD